ncbi:hypothetical protein JW916_00965 [Candidatus Sumerlaeota bacterium]|nr:hypothetical protein [Candidatus Sumerlaeota bacterium]
MKTLFREDFGSLDVGKFPSNYFAFGEYHFLTPETRKGPWYESTVSNAWRPAISAWVLIEDDGRRRMIQTLEDTNPFPRLLAAGDPLWADYTARVRVQPLKIDSGFVGMAFRHRHPRQYYRLALEEGKTLKIVKENHDEPVVLAECAFAYDNDTVYELFASVRGDRIEAGVDGETLLRATDSSYAQGNVGLIARSTAAFDSVLVEAEDPAFDAYVQTRSQQERELDAEREKYAKPVLWKKIDTRGFGTGRQLRFGHLKNREQIDFVAAQHVKLETEKDGYSAVRCLTAFDLDGNVLWQFGVPSRDPDAALVTCDVPCQIYDIDGDGRDEVLTLKNFKLYILDGRDGSVKNKTALPSNPAAEDRFGHVLGDSIVIANFRGKARPSDILIKDRYSQVWVYDDNLNLLWSARRPKGQHLSNTGHFPVPCDVNGDGRDELFCGYTLFDCEGRVLWNHDWPDHTDEICIGRFNPDRSDMQIATASGDAGFNIFSADGQVLHHEVKGHAQRIGAARFRDDLPGLQFYVITFWHHPSIVSLHNCTGRRLFDFGLQALGNILNPVNWTGSGTELALLSGNVEHGGMIDGQGRCVVLFPGDGHPQLCSEARDLAGDARDEILHWDTESIWIYTQDRPFEGDRIYSPIRPNPYNNSNYRGETSLPNWEPRG